MLTESITYYRRNILISIIISEILIISAFIFSPKTSDTYKKVLYKEPVILFENIPRTIQSKQVQKHKPEIPPIYIPDEVEAYKLLDDVILSSNVSGQKNNSSRTIADLNNIRRIRSVPRQIFEVVPADGDERFNGRLQLSLKINEKGQVVDHRILFNSLDCTDCLNDIIKAAYRSKWEPAIVDGKNTDYWVVKSYIFN